MPWSSTSTTKWRPEVEAASVTAIGGFRHALLGYFDWSSKETRRSQPPSYLRKRRDPVTGLPLIALD
jgi:hypothetical protein